MRFTEVGQEMPSVPGLIICALTRLRDNLFAVMKLLRSFSNETYFCNLRADKATRQSFCGHEIAELFING